MSETTFFLNMFSEYKPPEALESAFSQAAVVAADIDPAMRIVAVCVESPRYIPMRLIDQIAEEIAKVYDLRALELTAVHPATELEKIEPAELMAMFVAQNSMNRGSLAGATWTWEETTLHIQLVGNGKALLDKAVPVVAQTLQERFGTPVTICITAGQNLEGQALFEAMEKMREGMIDALPKVVKEEKKPQAAPQSEAIYGKPFKGTLTDMKDLELNMGLVDVQGRVFALAHKELPKNNAHVINFDITDYTSSVRISRYLTNAEAKPILDGIKVGDVVKVHGKLQIDNYTNEMVMKPFSIMPGKMLKRVDTAPDGKRVELHLHTVMSNMDALTDTAAAIKQAAAWGHKAIAITDHGCVQSFTDALHTLEDWKGAPKIAGTDDDIKVLYGCEGYYINDVDDRLVVHGDGNMPLNGAFVAFDLETTGLSSKNDEIIEIGAVLIENGKELERFQTFVNPGRKLSDEIIRLTGITDDLLTDAPDISQVLPKFMEFVGDHILVAHNSKFDTGFIRAACERLGIPYTCTDADTLVLAQQLLPQLGRYKLDVVAKALTLPDFKHHRAADDAHICGLIMVKFLEMLKDMGIADLQCINGVLMKQRSKGVIFARKAQHIVLIAKNQIGLRNLYQLISRANLEYYKGNPRIPKSELLELREGLIIGSACENNELFQAVLAGKSDAELKRIAEFYDYL